MEVRGSADEAALYAAVTTYVREEMNRAELGQDGKRRSNVGFALQILQRSRPRRRPRSTGRWSAAARGSRSVSEEEALRPFGATPLQARDCPALIPTSWTKRRARKPRPSRSKFSIKRPRR